MTAQPHPGLFDVAVCARCGRELKGGACPLCASFDGDTYDHAKDGDRLTGQLEAVHETLLAGGWWTLSDIQGAIGKGSEAGISARIRDLRKPKFGGHEVERRRCAEPGLWEYRLVQKERAP